MDDTLNLSNRVISKLGHETQLTNEEVNAVGAALSHVRKLPKGETIIRENESADAVTFLLSGFACRSKSLPGGEQQILSFNIPGDLLDQQGLLLGRTIFSAVTLTPALIAQVPLAVFTQLVERYSGLRRALWRDMAVDGAIAQEWMVGMGRRSAYGRVAHLMCELLSRLTAVGLAHDRSCQFPFIQNDLADALGLSTVHLNRVLQQLRREKLITLRAGVLSVQDWTGLAKAGNFDPAYLFL